MDARSELVMRLAIHRVEQLGGLSAEGFSELVLAVHENPEAFCDRDDDRAFLELLYASGARIAEIAGLTKETLVVGMGDHVEIWNPALFAAYNEMVDQWTGRNEQASEQASDVALQRKAQGEALDY